LNAILCEGGVQISGAERAELLLNIAVYWRKTGLDEAKILAQLIVLNKGFVPPVPVSDLRRTVETVVQWSGDSYRCAQQPLARVCQKGLCLERRFGIAAPPVGLRLGTVVKLIDDDVTWIWRINETDIRFTTREILSQSLFLRRVEQELSLRVSTCSTPSWLSICAHALANATHVTARPVDPRWAHLVRYLGEVQETLPFP
jgi:hypothetical protein